MPGLHGARDPSGGLRPPSRGGGGFVLRIIGCCRAVAPRLPHARCWYRRCARPGMPAWPSGQCAHDIRADACVREKPSRAAGAASAGRAGGDHEVVEIVNP